MPIAGMNPQIANFNLHQPRFARPANDAMIQRPAKKFRENRNDVDLQKPKPFTAEIAEYAEKTNP